ncbi:uncharacterized protein LOC112087465 [Eutrema salsugineum]|uniref:uncharacterized protein LOC112087465 n=1 Tax=Eutrema salsugineum TaxID=72664 RepID=UPI000CED50D6|nr:uncharacterized protein LOC112087465 [Eutrema salsugineum]
MERGEDLQNGLVGVGGNSELGEKALGIGAQDDEAEWETVKPISSNRSKGKQTKEVEEVVLFSRFDSLLENEDQDGGEEVAESREGEEVLEKEVEKEEVSVQNLLLSSKEKSRKAGEKGVVRISLSRESKSSHKFVQQAVKPSTQTSPGNSSVRVTPVFKSSQLITVLVKLQGMDEEFLCSFVYGSNLLEERKMLWEDLCSHFDSPIYRRLRWMILGDYNEILSREEHGHSTTNSINSSGMMDFQNLVRDGVLCDLGYHGPLYTWCNKRTDGLVCKKLDRLLDLNLSNPSENAQKEENDAFHRWEASANIEERYLYQKSKLTWMNVGDKNTKIYHRAVQVRAAKNGIRELQAEDGTISTGSQTIKDLAVNHFNQFLNHVLEEIREIHLSEICDLMEFRCTLEDQRSLTHEVTEAEIKGVLFAMATNKSPGPDGFTVEFFKDAWSVIRKDLVVRIQSFFTKGFLPKELVSGYHLDSISSRCALKIDVSKAFDSVHWKFLLTILEALNFPMEFVHWVHLCITTASFQSKLMIKLRIKGDFDFIPSVLDYS